MSYEVHDTSIDIADLLKTGYRLSRLAWRGDPPPVTLSDRPTPALHFCSAIQLSPFSDPLRAQRWLWAFRCRPMVMCMAIIRDTENGWDFDLAILMLAAMLCLLGVGILYLAEREHGPQQSRMIVTGPPDLD
jgi:hypothetical protein